MLQSLKKYSLYLAWITALAATAGSLYFSEIAHYTPCSLCWWQRVLMYPLVVILAVGIAKRVQATPYFVLPFSVLGAGVAAYQEALTLGWLPETISSCSATVSCTVKYINWFGFVTIPLLSLLAFIGISKLMILLLWKNK